MLAIRVYLWGGRFPDAVDVYCSASGADRNEGNAAVAEYYQNLRHEPGYRLKALWFRFAKSLSIAVPFVIEWALVGCLWNWALVLPLFKTTAWIAASAFVVGMLVGQTITRKDHALAAGSIFMMLAIAAGAIAIVLKIVLWLV